MVFHGSSLGRGSGARGREHALWGQPWIRGTSECCVILSGYLTFPLVSFPRKGRLVLLVVWGLEIIKPGRTVAALLPFTMGRGVKLYTTF